MTDERLEQFAERINALATDFGPEIGGNADKNIEAVLYGIAELIENEKQNYLRTTKSKPHSAVVGCLDGCIEMLRHAGFAYYASFK